MLQHVNYIIHKKFFNPFHGSIFFYFRQVVKLFLSVHCYRLVKVSNKSCLAPPVGLVRIKRLNIVLSNGVAQSASWQSRANSGDSQRHTTATGLRRSEPNDTLASSLRKRERFSFVSNHDCLAGPSRTKKRKRKEDRLLAICFSLCFEVKMTTLWLQEKTVEF